MAPAARASLLVAFGRVLERKTELVGQRGQPGQDVTELVELLFRRAFADRLGEFAQLLG